MVQKQYNKLKYFKKKKLSLLIIVDLSLPFCCWFFAARQLFRNGSFCWVFLSFWTDNLKNWSFYGFKDTYYLYAVGWNWWSVTSWEVTIDDTSYVTKLNDSILQKIKTLLPSDIQWQIEWFL